MNNEDLLEHGAEDLLERERDLGLVRILMSYPRQRPASLGAYDSGDLRPFQKKSAARLDRKPDPREDPCRG